MIRITEHWAGLFGPGTALDYRPDGPPHYPADCTLCTAPDHEAHDCPEMEGK